MSNEVEKITTVEKFDLKIKDPRRVEAGKRLAKISQEAKERKKRQRMEEEKRNYIDFKYIVGGVTILGGLVGLYFAYKKDKREIKEERILEDNNKFPVEKKRCDIENL